MEQSVVGGFGQSRRSGEVHCEADGRRRLVDVVDAQDHRLAAGQAAAVGVHHIEAVARLGLEVGRGVSLTWPVASMPSNDASVPVRLPVLVTPAPGSLAAAVYSTKPAPRVS